MPDDDDALEVEEFEVDELELDDVPFVDELESELESLLAELESLFVELESFDASLPLPLSFEDEEVDDEPLAEDFDARESVTYQPLPLN